MSSFIGTNTSSAGVSVGCQQDDIRLWEQNEATNLMRWLHVNEAWHHFGFVTGWWPGTSSVNTSGAEWHAAVSYTYPELYSGAISKMAFTGVTRDVYGSILGGCIVKLYKTANIGFPGTKDTLLDETTSDVTTGVFVVYTPYHPDTHYLVSYKVGSPDVEGTTVNTLIGA